MENEKLIFEFSQQRHRDQLIRSTELDQKSGLLLSFNVALLGLVGVFLGSDSTFDSESNSLVVFTIVFLLIFLSFQIVGIYYFIEVLRLRKFDTPVPNQRLLETIGDENYEKNLLDFGRKYILCYKNNSGIVKEKAEKFKCAIGMVFASTLILTIIFFVFLFQKLI